MHESGEMAEVDDESTILSASCGSNELKARAFAAKKGCLLTFPGPSGEQFNPEKSRKTKKARYRRPTRVKAEKWKKAENG